MNRFRDWFTALIHPKTWIQNYPYSETWDRVLNELMREHQFVRVDNYHAALGGITLWVENHPYASFHTLISAVRPSRATILRAGEKLQEDYLRAVLEKDHD